MTNGVNRPGFGLHPYPNTLRLRWETNVYICSQLMHRSIARFRCLQVSVILLWQWSALYSWGTWERSPKGCWNLRETHICKRHLEPHPSWANRDICQHDPPPPLSAEVKGKRRGWETWHLTSRRKETVDPLNIYSIWQQHVPTELHVYHAGPWLHLKSLVQTRWVSMLLSEVAGNNRASPSKSQWASLAAAISAPAPLLITSVDHLCAITYI